jgi:hypothetical protein
MPRCALAFVVVCSLASMVVSACSHGGGAPEANPLAPAAAPAAYQAAIVPSPVPVSPTPAAPFTAFGTAVCPTAAPAFTSTFRIVIDGPSAAGMQVDHVTFHFLDGSNVTSMPITFSRDAIHASAPGVFPFTIGAGCGFGRPQSLLGDLVFIDAFGVTHTATVRAGAR